MNEFWNQIKLCLILHETLLNKNLKHGFKELSKVLVIYFNILR